MGIRVRPKQYLPPWPYTPIPYGPGYRTSLGNNTRYLNAEGGCGAGGTMCEGGRCPHDGELMNGGYVRKCHCSRTGSNDFSCCSCSRVKPEWGRYADYQSEMMYNNDYYRATGGGNKYVCDGCPDSGALCNPSNNTCPEGCSCTKATVITVEGGKVAQDTGRLQRMGRRTDDEFNPNPPITPTSGRSVDPTDPRWRDRRYSRFTGPNNEHQPGNFLTDDPGDTQSMNEFINDVP